jgi:tetratricopeptide (TPR) repeat protein
VLIRRAELYREARQWQQALADLNRAEHLDPTRPGPDLVRAHVFLDARNWTDAIAAATRFLARQPRDADALIVRGRAQAGVGSSHAAIADFSLALEERPLPEVYIDRARVSAGLGRGGLEEAVTGLDAGIARLGPIVTLELEAVDAELRLKRYDAALARLDRVSAHASRKDSWLARRGAVLEHAGRLDEARATYRAALDSANSQPDSIRKTRASLALTDRLRDDIDRLTIRVTPATHGLKRNR